jgi:hypothetical protein
VRKQQTSLMATPAQVKARARLRTLVRLTLVVIVAVLVNIGLNRLQAYFAASQSPGMQLALTGIVIFSLLFYALLMAIPFVPGLEIGLSLLMMQGPAIAPFVFLATFTGLTIAYLFGRYLSYRVLHGLFDDLGLHSACRLIERLHPLEREERLDLLRENLPKWLGHRLVRYRYLTIAVALNVPGNAFIGGGGGIALLAGISRLFSTRNILICFALAVSPVPIMVYFWGLDVLSWW